MKKSKRLERMFPEGKAREVIRKKLSVYEKQMASCKGKVKYANQSDARKGMNDVKNKSFEMAVYGCEFCKGFHFGRAPWLKKGRGIA
jgi:hypothetical protein